MMVSDIVGQIHVLLGLPGSGKGTQAGRICADIDIAHLSSGVLFRGFGAHIDSVNQNSSIRSYIDRGELVPDDLACNVVMQEIESIHRKGKGVILDGFPRTLNQAEFLDKSLAERGGNITSVINLYVSEEISLERILSRGRHDDLPEIARRRLDLHQQLSAPVLDYYRSEGRLLVVNGDRDEDEVQADLLRAIGSQI